MEFETFSSFLGSLSVASERKTKFYPGTINNNNNDNNKDKDKKSNKKLYNSKIWYTYSK